MNERTSVAILHRAWCNGDVPERRYIYVDGESHFERSTAAWRRIVNDTGATLKDVTHVGLQDDGLLLVIPEAKVFWSRQFSPGCERYIYFCTCLRDDTAAYGTQVLLQEFDLEPNVTIEDKQLYSSRQGALKEHNIIEKPKGVDAKLFVQVLDDAYSERFDECHIYTSDADYAPLVEAVRRRGKRVYVYGFDKQLGKMSPLRHVSSRFYDLEDIYRKEFSSKQRPIADGNSL